RCTCMYSLWRIKKNHRRRRRNIKFGRNQYRLQEEVQENITKLTEMIEQKRQRTYNQNLLYSSSKDSDSEEDENMNKRPTKKKVEPYKETLQKIVQDKLEKKKELMKKNEQDVVMNKKKEENKNEPELRSLYLELEQTQEKVRKLESEKEDLLLEVCQLRKLNIDLQQEIINKFKGLDKEIVNSSCEIEVGQIVGENVHIGQDIYIPVSAYNSIKTLTDTPQQFVKAMAVAVFGLVTLTQSSVTGKSSNRTRGSEARPALDPTKLRAICGKIYIHFINVCMTYLDIILKKKNTDEVCIDLQMKNVGTYIARKIADLNRKKPVQKNDITEGAVDEEEGEEEGEEEDENGVK
ncbi:hypothetical protein NQ314_011682, partial [Rhamnusium bicolor]